METEHDKAHRAHTLTAEDRRKAGQHSKKVREARFADSVRFLVGKRANAQMEENAAKLFAEGEQVGELSALDAIVAAQIKEAYKGNTKAASFLLAASGEQPTAEQQDVPIIIDYDGLD